jgi:hypothetical protein
MTKWRPTFATVTLKDHSTVEAIDLLAALCGKAGRTKK